MFTPLAFNAELEGSPDNIIKTYHHNCTNYNMIYLLSIIVAKKCEYSF
jgi:hypothetical protein